jgi:hypothetical protein
MISLLDIWARMRDMHMYKKPSKMEGKIIQHAWWESSSVVMILEQKIVMRKMKRY